jgi:hypothetical protein
VSGVFLAQELQSASYRGVFRPMSSEAVRGSGRRGGSAPVARSFNSERLLVKSGKVLLIDQFMLSNQQFVSLFENATEDEFLPALSQAATAYGGLVESVEPGEYLVFRDPFQSTMVVCSHLSCPILGDVPQGELSLELLVPKKEYFRPIGRVFVDTRCLVFVDAIELRGGELLGAYSRARATGDEKRARDLVRESGGAVRYGFNQLGDELAVFRRADDDCLALWPDIVEGVQAEDEAIEAEF